MHKRMRLCMRATDALTRLLSAFYASRVQFRTLLFMQSQGLRSTGSRLAQGSTSQLHDSLAHCISAKQSRIIEENPRWFASSISLHRAAARHPAFFTTRRPTLQHSRAALQRRDAASSQRRTCRSSQPACSCSSSGRDAGHTAGAAAASSLTLWLLSELPALADTTDFSKGGFAKESYYVTLGLFLISLPGLWSQIKRAPKAKKVRKTFEVAGPAQGGALPLDERARQIFQYFKRYNYELVETGDTIRFAGTYAASRGQAAALIFYVFCGLASTALVLSIAAPFGGNRWYALTALSPLSGAYYWQRGTRKEEVQVKMVTSDDEATTDILCEGPEEEIERLRKEFGLAEKGKVLVKGLLER